MQDNPYYQLISLTRREAAGMQTTSFQIGKVISADPLKIDVCDTVQDKDSLKKADGLTFSAGDTVLLAMTSEDDDLIVLCKITEI